MIVCPAKAISVVPEDVNQLEDRVRELYPDRTLQDTWIWRRL